MKIYSFDGKKRNIDNFDINGSPLYMGRRFTLERDESVQEEENENDEEKQIEK